MQLITKGNLLFHYWALKYLPPQTITEADELFSYVYVRTQVNISTLPKIYSDYTGHKFSLNAVS